MSRKVMALLALFLVSTSFSVAASDQSESEFRAAAREWSSQPAIREALEKIRKDYSDPAVGAFKKREYADSERLGEAAIDALQTVDRNKYLQEKIYWALVENIRRYLEIQDFEHAQKSYEQMYRLCPDYPYYHRVDTLLRIGILKRFVKRKPLKFDLSILDPAPTKQSFLRHDLMYGFTRGEGGVGGAGETALKEMLTEPEILTSPCARLFRERLVSLLKISGRKSEAFEVEQQLKDKHCPICHSDENVVRISYGLPLGGARSDSINGGCVIGIERFYCKSDKLRF